VKLRTLAAGVLLFQLLGASAAEARYYDLHSSYRESPQWFAAEIKFGPYKPDIDSEVGGSPYEDIFGRRLQLMSQFTLDVQFLKKHGTLGVGGTFGVFAVQGKALLEDGSKSSDETSLNVFPLILSVVYRWDYAAKTWNVPLVPYVRAGIVYAFYYITQGSGKLARYPTSGDKARGGIWGYQINLGLAFLLDVLEPSAAKKLDSEIGVNHTYLFCEFVHSRIDNFGGDRIRLGMPYSLLAGIAAEF
jgi:hypothetical protein